MNDRPDELFLIDVDQEAKELAQYGAGAAELSSDRLTASLHYVSSLLISVNLHAHASFASSFARGAKRMEEGEARRTARDFAEILRRGIEAIRSDNQSDHDQDIPESLWERLPEAFRVDAAPASSALLDLERSDQTKPRSGSGVFEDAARTLAAADEFAALLRTRSLAATAVTSPASHASGLSRDISDDADRFAPEESSEPPEIAAAAGSVAKVDECFRRAVRVAEGDVQVWPPGMQALFDAIDELDRMPLEKALPWQVQLVGGAEAKISAQLAEALGKALDQARLRGELEALADAMVVSHTLILSLQCEEALNPTPLARFAANFSGRLETSDGDRRIRLTLPASRRLLRIVPLRLGEDWFAVPWAQFVGLEEAALGDTRSVKVSLGNTPDRIRVDEVGLVSVGVWYELPKPLRHRDRYRGIALVSRGNPLPVFG